MKKIYFFLLLFLFANGIAKSQALLSEGFEKGNFPPAGWTLINAGNGNDWLRNDNLLFFDQYVPAYSGTKCAVYAYNTLQAANAWMISPALNLKAGQSYGISFYYRVLDAQFPEKLKVTVGQNATVLGQSNVLWKNNGRDSLTNTDYLKAIIQYVPSTDGNYYFGFNCYSNPDENLLLIDSIVIQTAPAAPPVCTTNLTPADNTPGVQRPTTTLSWTNVATATGYDLYFGTANPPVEFLGSIASNQTPLTGLDYNTKYYWYVVPYNAAGYATGCNAANVTSFTTIPLPPKPNCTTNITPVNNAINISNPSAAFSVNPVAGATKYNLYLTDEAASFILISTYDSPNFTYTNLKPNNPYSWYVIPENDGGKATGCNVNKTIFSTGSALPVQFLYFRATPVNETNVLNWATASENNNSYFDIEKSADGNLFKSLDKVPAKAKNGNADIVNYYFYTDTKPLVGDNFYRLKQVDIDGKEKYSTVVNIKNNFFNAFDLSFTYPNPSSDIVHCKIFSPLNQEIHFIITDAAGKTVKAKQSVVSKGENNIPVDIKMLPGGIYFLKVIDRNGRILIKRIIKNE